MRKYIVTYNEVIELNHLLEGQGLNFKLHLRDACGSQSFLMEPFSNCSCEGRYEDMMREVSLYFEKKGIVIKFLENQLQFVIQD